MAVPPITRIYVLTCRLDFHLTRLCVASIRHWYPDIPVSLMVDYEAGNFDPRPLERAWNLERFETPIRRFGWGFSRLELFFRPDRERYLAIDSDIVFLGPVLDRLNGVSGDFIVHPDEKSKAGLTRATFDPDLLARFDPSFVVPRTVFNCGQYVGTSGLLRREDFDPVIEWSSPRRPRHPEIFKNGDQGMTNYVVAKAEAAGRVTVAREKIFLWPKGDTSAITIQGLAEKKSPPLLIHWAGFKHPDRRFMDRADILEFYATMERRRRNASTCVTDFMREHAPAKWPGRFRRAFKILSEGWVDGGGILEIEPDRLKNFYDLEQRAGVAWCWSQPRASINLAIRRGDYRVRLETGSPFPMLSLAELEPQFFINDSVLPAGSVRIKDGIVEFDLSSSLLHDRSPQVLGWSMNRLAAEGDERHLGMPVSAVNVFRR